MYHLKVRGEIVESGSYWQIIQTCFARRLMVNGKEGLRLDSHAEIYRDSLGPIYSGPRPIQKKYIEVR